MLNTTMTLVLTLSLGQYPVDNGNAIQGAIYGAPQQGMVNSGLPPYGNGEGPGGHFSAGLTGSNQDELYPYDGQEPWMHGYWQEIPAYGGYGAYRPYNYKHALAQSQASGGWGMSPQMPYSQQFWHRYQQRAEMLQQANNNIPPAYQNYRQPVVNYLPMQAPVYQNRIQPASYRPAGRTAQRRPATQSKQSVGFAERFAQTKQRVDANNKKKKSFLPNIFSRKK